MAQARATAERNGSGVLAGPLRSVSTPLSAVFPNARWPGHGWERRQWSRELCDVLGPRGPQMSRTSPAMTFLVLARPPRIHGRAFGGPGPLPSAVQPGERQIQDAFRP